VTAWNPWRTAVLAVGYLALATVLAGAAYGGLRGFQAYNYLNTPIGTVGGKPITRANYLDLLLARESEASKAPPVTAPAVK
jgi:hypothetical protein